MQRRYPLHVHISTLFLILILLIGGIIGGLGYKISQGILETGASELSERIGRETVREFASILSPAEMATRLMSLSNITEARTLEARIERISLMRQALNSASEVTGFYVGYENGDFFLMRRVWSDADRTVFNAPPNTAYIVQSIERDSARTASHFLFFDEALKLLRREERPEYAATYDPRSRDWYKAAIATPGQIKTPPYLFFSTQNIGITIANRSPNGKAVFGADIRLETLDHSLSRQKVSTARARVSSSIVTIMPASFSWIFPASFPQVLGKSFPPDRIMSTQAAWHGRRHAGSAARSPRRG